MQKRDSSSRGGGLGRVVRFGTTVHNTIPYKVRVFISSIVHERERVSERERRERSSFSRFDHKMNESLQKRADS